MSHTYLIDLYDLIDQRLQDRSSKSGSGNSEASEMQFQQGRADILIEFRQFLASHYNRKLPRRIRKNYSE